MRTLEDVVIAIGLACVASVALVKFCGWACDLYDCLVGRAK